MSTDHIYGNSPQIPAQVQACGEGNQWAEKKEPWASVARNPNWTPKVDEALCNAWLRVSEDAAVKKDAVVWTD